MAEFDFKKWKDNLPEHYYRLRADEPAMQLHYHLVQVLRLKLELAEYTDALQRTADISNAILDKHVGTLERQGVPFLTGMQQSFDAAMDAIDEQLQKAVNSRKP